MANHANSILAAAIYGASQNLQAVESRRKKYGATSAFLANMQSFDYNARLATVDQKPATIRMLKTDATTAGSTVSCNPSGTGGDSVDFALTWNTASVPLTIAESLAIENQMTLEQMVTQDMDNAWRGLHNKIEADALTFLEANRSGYDNGSGLSTWVSAASANYRSIPVASKDLMRSYMKEEIQSMDFDTPIDIIHSSPYGAFWGNTNIQGDGNARNYQDQDPDYSYFRTSNAVSVASTYGGMYLVPHGGINIIFWVAPRYRKNTIKGDKQWSTVKDPIFGMPTSVYTKSDCADTSAMGGEAVDDVTSAQFSIEYAFVYSEITAPALATPIMKYALATT